MILTQCQLIECWETFLMQLDADEDGEPFFKPQSAPPPVTAAPPNKPKDTSDEGGSGSKPQTASEDAGGTEAHDSEPEAEPTSAASE